MPIGFNSAAGHRLTTSFSRNCSFSEAQKIFRLKLFDFGLNRPLAVRFMRCRGDCDMKMIKGLLAVTAMMAARGANAAYIINFAQVGSDVVAIGSGSVNYSALEFETIAVTGTGVNASLGSIMLGSTDSVPLNRYFGAIRTVYSFGSGGPAEATSATGSIVKLRFDSGYVYVPVGYASGSQLGISTETFADSTFASLGLTPGTYAMNWGSGSSADFATVNIGPVGAVPEPGTWAMMLGGFGLLGGAARYRRRITIFSHA